MIIKTTYTFSKVSLEDSLLGNTLSAAQLIHCTYLKENCIIASFIVRLYDLDLVLYADHPLVKLNFY